MINNPKVGEIWCYEKEKYIVLDIIIQQEETYINFACLDSDDFGALYGDYELSEMQTPFWKKLV